MLHGQMQSYWWRERQGFLCLTLNKHLARSFKSLCTVHASKTWWRVALEMKGSQRKSSSLPFVFFWSLTSDSQLWGVVTPQHTNPLHFSYSLWTGMTSELPTLRKICLGIGFINQVVWIIKTSWLTGLVGFLLGSVMAAMRWGRIRQQH